MTTEADMDYTCVKHILDDPNFPECRREIRPNQAISIATERGTLVRCESGTLWLTQEGHRQDYILIPGAQYLSPDDRKIVVSSLGTSGAITVFRLKPGSGHGYGGGPLHIDRATVARVVQEARAARARLMREWAARLVAGARAVLHELKSGLDVWMAPPRAH
jgi:hypothetical protein